VPDIPGKADTVLVIDMMHYLPDDDLALLLKRIRKKCSPGCALILRGTIPLKQRATLLRSIELIWIKINGLTVHYRTAEEIVNALKHAGFSVSVKSSSNESREEKWFICKPRGRKNAGRTTEAAR
jgi:hypothetical protein